MKGLDNMYNKRPRRIPKYETDFFDKLSKKYNVIINVSPFNRSEIFIGMRRCINGVYLNKMRITQNYVNKCESVPEPYTLISVYEHIFEEMSNELEQGNGLKEKEIGGVTDWYK